MAQPQRREFIRCSRPVCESCDKEEQRQAAQEQTEKETEPIAYLAIPAKDLKMLREVLCRLQINAVWEILINPSIARNHLQKVIHEIDRHRPLGSDGKHGNLHTDTCGCEDK